MKKYITITTLILLVFSSYTYAKQVKVCAATRNMITPNKLPILCTSNWKDKQTTLKAEYKKGWRYIGVVNANDMVQIILEK